MLKFMRRQARSMTIKVLFWIIIAVFVLWGVGGFDEGGTRVAASVNGREILPDEVRRTALQLENFYRQIYGENFSPELATALDFRGRALEQIINSELLFQEAKRLGFSTSDGDVRQAIAEIPGLTVNGVFQRETYFRFLRSQGMTPAEFEDTQRRQLVIEKLQKLITGSIRPDEALVRDLYAFHNRKVNLSFLKVDASKLAAEIEISDEDVARYFEENREQFREPERAQIEYLAYRDQDFREKVNVTEEDVRLEYESHLRDRYTVPDEVHARHILLRLPPDASEQDRAEVRARAQHVLERVKRGDDFIALASELSEDPSNKDEGGDLGYFTRGRMEESFERAAFALEPGEVSDVVETRFGLHVIRVDEKRPERVQPFDEVQDQIIERLKTTRAREETRDAAFDDSHLATDGTPLAKIGKRRGLEVQTPPPFAKNEGVVGLPRIPDLVEEVFATPHGDAGPVAQGEGLFVVYRVTEKVPSQIPELQDVRSRVESMLRSRKSGERAKEIADGLRQKVAAGASLEEIATAEGLEIGETGEITAQGDYVPRIGNVPGLKEKAFELTPESPVLAEVAAAGNDAFVVVLKRKLAADLSEFEKNKEDLVSRQVEDQRQAAIEALLNDLKRRASIEINPVALADV